MKHVYYAFQCDRCFLVSGNVSTDKDDAPPCCGGEPMTALRREVELAEERKR